MRSTIPRTRGEVKPPAIPTSQVCDVCDGDSTDWIGGECRGCQGHGHVVTYEVGSKAWETLSGAETVEEFLERLRAEAVRVRSREMMFRMGHLHHQADLFAVQASTLQAVALALQGLLYDGPEPPRGLSIPARMAADLARPKASWWRRLLGAA